MRKYNIINLLKSQDKNIKLDNYKFNPDSNTAFFFISKKVTEHSYPCCSNKIKRIHNYRSQIINHSPLNVYFTKLVLKKTRLFCTNCGKKFYMNYNNIYNPKFWRSNSLFFDIINMLKNTSMTFELDASFFVYSCVIAKYLNFFYDELKMVIHINKELKRFIDWLNDALSSTLNKFESIANTFINWNKEVVNSLKYDYTNSATEEKNNKIKVIKRIAFGFRKFINLSNLIKISDLKHVEN